MQGQGEMGLAKIRQGLSGGKGMRSYFLGLMGEAYREEGNPEEGLSVLAETLAVMNETEWRAYAAELYRLSRAYCS